MALVLLFLVLVIVTIYITVYSYTVLCTSLWWSRWRQCRPIQRRWNEFKSGRHMSGAKRRKKTFVVPLHFFALQVQSIVLVSASVWSVQFDHFLVFCSSYSRWPRAQSFVKVGARAPVPRMELAARDFLGWIFVITMYMYGKKLNSDNTWIPRTNLERMWRITEII